MLPNPKPARKKRPTTVCPRCSGFMERRCTIREGIGARFWSDSKPYIRIDGMELHHHICYVCGHISAYTFDPKLKA